MDTSQATAVEQYLKDHLIASDEVLDATLAANRAAGLPSIDVSPTQGKLLHLLALLQGARKILEIGTLGAYSTIWLARALAPGGRLITLEADPKHAAVARSNIERAGLAETVQIHVGAALDTLPSLESEAPFDLIFIDADKPNNPHYLAWAVKFSRLHSLIIVDNVIRNGAVADSESTDTRVIGARQLIEAMAAEPRLSATALQTVGKGYDGFALALVISE